MEYFMKCRQAQCRYSPHLYTRFTKQTGPVEKLLPWAGIPTMLFFSYFDQTASICLKSCCQSTSSENKPAGKRLTPKHPSFISPRTKRSKNVPVGSIITQNHCQTTEPSLPTYMNTYKKGKTMLVTRLFKYLCSYMLSLEQIQKKKIFCKLSTKEISHSC